MGRSSGRKVRSGGRTTRASILGACCFLLAALIGARLASGPSAVTDPVPARTLDLSPSAQVEEALEAHAEARFAFWLESGDLLEVEVAQHGVDVVVRLLDPAGNLELEVDGMTGDEGVERLVAIAGQGGVHRLELAAGRRGGRVALHARRSLPKAADRSRAEAAEALWLAGSAEDKLVAYDRSAELARRAGDPFLEAEAHDRSGRIADRLGDARRAAHHHATAAELYAEAGDVRRQAISLTHLGRAHFTLGEPHRALEVYEAALPLRELARDRRGAAITSSNLGQVHRALGQFDRAIARYDAALALWRGLGDERSEGLTLHNLGVLYQVLGERRRARDHLERAARRFERHGVDRWFAAALNMLGEIERGEGDLSAARDLYLGALEVHRRLENRRGQAVSESNLGYVALLAGDLEEAGVRLRSALALAEAVEDRAAQAAAAQNLGDLALARGESASAEPWLERALELHQAAGSRAGEAGTRFSLAEVRAGEGDLDGALAEAERASAAIESLRREPPSLELRSTYFATFQQRYDTYIELLLERASGSGDMTFAARALEVSERARARSLLDALATAGARARSEADPEQQRRIESLGARLEELEARKAGSEESSAALDREIGETLDELALARGRSHGDNPRYTTWSNAHTVDLETIQRELLEAGTLLLVVRSSDPVSHLWAVTPTEVDYLPLASSAEIEPLAKALVAALEGSHRRESAPRVRRLGCALTEAVLQPVAERLTSAERLVVVADGALSGVPFAALPAPGSECSDAAPLVATHEIVRLPSASTLVASRRQPRSNRSGAGPQAVIFADPVFSAADERLPPDVQTPEEVGWRRLPESAREARAIAELLPAREVEELVGFEATREAVFSETVARARWLHFATHSAVDLEEPRLSRVMLSRYREDGSPRNGQLHAYEIFGLRLSADLVVLSSCETAVGVEVRGEGVNSLVQPFLYAGAAGLVVSLWAVDDRATAELMELFWRLVLVEALTPDAALASAQRTLWRAGRAPSEWAGFVFVGEWRNRAGR